MDSFIIKNIGKGVIVNLNPNNIDLIANYNTSGSGNQNSDYHPQTMARISIGF